MWAMSSVQKLRIELMRSIVPVKANSSARATPVTISGFVIGMFVSVMTALRSLPFIEWMPTAAIVPTTVAMTLESTAMISELRRSVSSVESLKRFAYCRSVKPLNVAMSRPVLNEATASRIIGIYRKIKTRMVTVRLKCFIPLP